MIVSTIEEIPGSSLTIYGDGKYISLPVNQNEAYRIELTGLDDGIFILEIEEVTGNDIVDSKEFEYLPSTPNMKANMTATTLQNSTPLAIDID